MTLHGYYRSELGIAALILGLAVAGCRVDTGPVKGLIHGPSAITAPQEPSIVSSDDGRQRADVYPVSTGNPSEYRGRLRVSVVEEPGNGERTVFAISHSMPFAKVQKISASRLSTRLAESLEGLLHRVEAVRTMTRLGSQSMTAVGTGDDELVRYLLEPGSSWVIQSDPFYAAEVEALERISVPTGEFHACRVRISGGSFGPDDRVLVWYGSGGMLRMTVHVESVGEAGRVIVNHSDELASYGVTPSRGSAPRP